MPVLEPTLSRGALRRTASRAGRRRARAGVATRAGRACVLAAALLAALGSCAEPPSQAAETARAWGEGPARWLLLPDEKEALNGVRTNAEFARFLAAFWARRDDDPSTGDNPVARLFAERVQAADRLYAERHVRGSLTDRGRALVVLGPPRFLRITQRRAPALEGATLSGGRATRMIDVEVWGYLPPDLPAPLRERLAAQGARGDEEMAVSFVITDGRARLVDGEDLLRRAACAIAHCSG